MTTTNEAREAIYQHFVDNFTGVIAARITFENEDFTPPADVAWVRLTVRNQAAAQESLGGIGYRRFARYGSVFVQIFVPLDDGVRSADLLAQQAKTALEGVTLLSSTVWLRTASVREIGPSDGWYAIVVEVNLEYNETK